MLNLLSLLLVILLILVPELYETEDNINFDISVCTPTIDQRWVPATNSAADCCTQIYNEKNNFDFDTSNFFPELFAAIQDLLQGTNWMEYSAMFYGYYRENFTKLQKKILQNIYVHQ